MASKKEDQEKAEKPGVKKREKKAPRSAEAGAPKSKDKDGVVRAPQAPTTAPNAPKLKAEEEKRAAAARRVVDPKEEARKEALAKEKREKEAAKKKAAEEARQKEAARKLEEKKKKEAAQAAKEAAKKPKESPMADVGFSFDAEDATMDDFAAMLDADGGTSGGLTNIRTGDVVEGTVVSIGARYIFVNLGGPDEGVADRGQYIDEEGKLTLSVGDTVEFYVVGLRDGIQLGREISSDRGALDAIEIAHSSGVPISGRVTGTNKGGFEVNISGIEAFCPISQIDIGFTEDPEVHVGQTYQFEVSEVREGGRTVVVSRSALMERERAEQRSKTLETLEVGQKVEGVITRVADFGAFIDIGGIEGLAHVSELSHVYFDKPSDVVTAGETVTVEIMSIEEDTKRDNSLRIGLSIKEAQQDPWMEVNEKFAVGQKVRGTIVRLAPFGAFVEILPGIEGLVHVSEMSWEQHVATPADVVEAGEVVEVEIQDIDLMRRRISLSMKSAEGDPWRNVHERFKFRQEVTGVVSNVEDFGAFIDLGEGITALLPRSEMNLPAEVTPHRKFTQGQEVTARVLNIEAERNRMALSLKDEAEIERLSGDRKDDDKKPRAPQAPRSYQDDAVSKKGTFGTLGDLLNARKNKD